MRRKGGKDMEEEEKEEEQRGWGRRVGAWWGGREEAGHQLGGVFGPNSFHNATAAVGSSRVPPVVARLRELG